jgi:hypothetical protein
MKRAEHRKGVLLMIGYAVLVHGRNNGAQPVLHRWHGDHPLAIPVHDAVRAGVLVVRYRGATPARIQAVGIPGVIVGALWALM